MAHTVVVAVPSALLAAAAFGLTGALQHRADREVAKGERIGAAGLLVLLRSRLWLASLMTTAVGLACQGLALASGPLILVQPLLVTGVIFGAVFAALLAKRSLDRVVLLGTLTCSAGLATFLVLARPSAGRPGEPGLGSVLPLALALAVIVVGARLVGARVSGAAQSLALALAAGVLYGLTAGLAKLALTQLQAGGLGVMISNWPVWGLVVIGPLGFLFNQQAFGAGVAVAPALAVMTMTDPLVSLAVGTLWLGEDVRSGAAIVLGEVLALIVVIAGVVVLTWRAPQAVRSEEAPPRTFRRAHRAVGWP